MLVLPLSIYLARHELHLISFICISCLVHHVVPILDSLSGKTMCMAMCQAPARLDQPDPVIRMTQRAQGRVSETLLPFQCLQGNTLPQTFKKDKIRLPVSTTLGEGSQTPRPTRSRSRSYPAESPHIITITSSTSYSILLVRPCALI
jgi:hypothetical protein